VLHIENGLRDGNGFILEHQCGRNGGGKEVFARRGACGSSSTKSAQDLVPSAALVINHMQNMEIEHLFPVPFDSGASHTLMLACENTHYLPGKKRTQVEAGTFDSSYTVWLWSIALPAFNWTKLIYGAAVAHVFDAH
jgi:hypothetical protein